MIPNQTTLKVYNYFLGILKGSLKKVGVRMNMKISCLIFILRKRLQSNCQKKYKWELQKITLAGISNYSEVKKDAFFLNKMRGSFGNFETTTVFLFFWYQLFVTYKYFYSKNLLIQNYGTKLWFLLEWKL